MIEKENLPESWTIAKLGELCEIIMGQSPPSETYNAIGIGLPFFQGKKEFTELHPVVEKWCSEPNKTAEANDILISVRAPVGDTNIANQKCCIGRGLAAIRYPYNNYYILYFLKLIKEQLNTKGTGTTFKAISGEILKNTPIPLAPVPEQTRILAKLEQLLTGLDKGIEYLKTAQQQLKIYRQSVLKWAFEGKLSKDISIWSTIPLGNVADAIDPQPSHRTPPISKDNIPYVSTKDVDHETDSIDFNLARKVSKSVLEEHLKRYKLENGDFIIGKIGTIGKPVRVVLPQNYTLSANVVLIQPRKINSKFLYYLFKSDLIELQFRRGQKATAQAAFGIQKVRTMEIPYPEQIQQEKIVSEIESRLSVCDKIEEIIGSSLQQAEALRLSIIKKAFEGKLVPQDPTDEPAEKLLERIRAAKTKAAPAGRKVNSKKSQNKTTSSIGAIPIQ